MPRQARLDAPGTLHHVILRGIERGTIVADAEDRAGRRRGRCIISIKLRDRALLRDVMPDGFDYGDFCFGEPTTSFGPKSPYARIRRHVTLSPLLGH